MCCPSRTAHLTGQFGHNNGVMVNAAPPDWLAKEHKLLPTWLRRAGYRTAYFGKYFNFYGSAEVPQLHVPPGWSYWSGIPAPWMHRYYDFKINQNGTLHPFPEIGGQLPGGRADARRRRVPRAPAARHAALLPPGLVPGAT